MTQSIAPDEGLFGPGTDTEGDDPMPAKAGKAKVGKVKVGPATEPEPEAAYPEQAEWCYRTQEANPARSFEWVPLGDTGKPGGEGKKPLPPKGWPTSGGYDLTDPLWKRANGHGVILTNNRWLFGIDIDADSRLTHEQRIAIAELKALSYKTGKGRHHLVAIPEDNLLPPMNSATRFGINYDPKQTPPSAGKSSTTRNGK